MCCCCCWNDEIDDDNGKSKPLCPIPIDENDENDEDDRAVHFPPRAPTFLTATNLDGYRRAPVRTRRREANIILLVDLMVGFQTSRIVQSVANFQFQIQASHLCPPIIVFSLIYFSLTKLLVGTTVLSSKQNEEGR